MHLLKKKGTGNTDCELHVHEKNTPDRLMSKFNIRQEQSQN